MLPPITCSILRGLVTCITPPALGMRQILISFSLSLTCLLLVSPSLKWEQKYILQMDIVTMLGESHGATPSLGAGLDKTVQKQIVPQVPLTLLNDWCG